MPKLETNNSLELEELESKRTKCEVYSRVVGYMRPVNSWNDAKKSEFFDRKTFKIDNK